MSETKAQLENRINSLIKENDELRAENSELRKFVLYVKGLKTEEEFLNLKVILEEVDNYFNSGEDEGE